MQTIVSGKIKDIKLAKDEVITITLHELDSDQLDTLRRIREQGTAHILFSSSQLDIDDYETVVPQRLPGLTYQVGSDGTAELKNEEDGQMTIEEAIEAEEPINTAVKAFSARLVHQEESFLAACNEIGLIVENLSNIFETNGTEVGLEEKIAAVKDMLTVVGELDPEVQESITQELFGMSIQELITAEESEGDPGSDEEQNDEPGDEEGGGSTEEEHPSEDEEHEPDQQQDPMQEVIDQQQDPMQEVIDQQQDPMQEVIDQQQSAEDGPGF